MWKNKHHLPLPALRLLFDSYLERYSTLTGQSESELAQHLEFALGNLTSSAAFKLVHPLLIEAYRAPRMKFRDKPLDLAGLDIETDATTGEPHLLGIWYQKDNNYHSIFKPTLSNLLDVIQEYTDNSPGFGGFVVWGRLDIQCLIRLFDPTEKERAKISRGLSANIKRGEIIGSPPISRKIGKILFYISHYIPGRSLKLGYLVDGRERVVWIYNLSQFWQNKIATTAKGLSLQWTDYPEDSHIIDWPRFGSDNRYRKIVLASNRQDARIVTELGAILQNRFHDAFECYPTLLVSTGSLTDAAVSKMLNEDSQAYASNSWKWLVTHTWRSQHPDVIAKTETLLAEAFSAGYVDQFGLGYYQELHCADIASAYPHKIRQLPDLRYASLLDGKGNLDVDLQTAQGMGYEIETAIIQGVVTIPPTLRFHPITVKTNDRENFRPIGVFKATYLLEERKFCQQFGATFDHEEYIIVGLAQRQPSPIAAVSVALGTLRTKILAELKSEPNESKRKVLDGQQYMVKVVDNSLYGKTVMTTEVVKDIDGEPVITGYIAGDRFNQLYGAIITARTRIQLANACMQIVQNGGRPVLCMTDSVYWQGTITNLPDSLIRTVKTPGFFDPPKSVSDFFLLKTGQYEYREGTKWHYKMRGLNVDWDELDGTQSLYHRLVTEHCQTIPRYTHPKDIIIKIPTRKLVTIGSPDLESLGLIREGVTELRPFAMSSKQSEMWILHWADTLTGHVWLDTPTISKAKQQYPLDFLSLIYTGHVSDAAAVELTDTRKHNAARQRTIDEQKRLFLWHANVKTDKGLPEGRMYRHSWQELETFYGVTRTEMLGESQC